MKSDKQLLREYVLQVLLEDEGGDMGAGDYGGLGLSDANVGPYGMHYGSGQDLYKIFVKPFTDVVQTAAGKTKETSAKAQTLLKVAFETLATTLIPVLRDDYSEIFAKEKQQVDKIRQQYSAVYKSNWDAFKDKDLVVAAFMYSPAAFITTKFAQHSPKVAASLISIVSGGTLDPWLAKVKDKFGIDSSGPSRSAHEGVLREDGENKPKLDVGHVLSNKKVIEKLSNSPTAKQMQNIGQAMVRETLGSVFKKAQGVLSANSLQDLQTKTGVKLKGMDKLQQIPEQERKASEQTLLTGAKKSMKAFYVKNLEGQVEEALKSGVPESHPYISDYRKVISKIKAL